ncbi:hypothetical protein PINS_up005480 [Pythium insidiosum]|nr:hypothetical protein PINS_up005480 [Pythium insidiosum]
MRRRCDASLVVLATLFLTLMMAEAVAGSDDPVMPTIIECSACDVPVPQEIPFCAAVVKYSSCRTAPSWKTMDHAASTEFKALGAQLSPSCSTSLQRAICTKHFNVCEMGSPQELCRSSCALTIAANCSMTVDTTTVCGSSQRTALGVTEGGKCFDVDYEGPQRTAWVIGFSIAVVFSFLASVGINLQKRALKQNEVQAHENNVEPRPAYRLPLWVLGFVLILAGSILDFVAFGLAPQSLLAPLAALTLVWNMMLAPCFNKEKLSKKDIVATLIIFAGATIAVVFASHSSPSYNLSMLLHLYKDPLTCIYFGVVVCCVALHYSLISFVEKLSLTSRRHRMIQVGQPMLWSKVRLIGYAGLAGTMGGQSVLFAKSTAELLKSAFHGDDSFAHFETYLIMVALLLCLLCQIHFLNCGLLHYDALSVVPIYQAYWIISGVLGGVIYFQEIRSFSVEQACMFVLGIMTTIFGVGLLSQRKPATQLSMKRKSERSTSFTTSDSKLDPIGKPGPLPSIAEVPDTLESRQDDQVHVEMPPITENESELSTTEESDEDENPDAIREGDDEVSRHVIDNYLDMSATMCFTEILDGLGFQSSSTPRVMLTRRPSSRALGHDNSNRAPRRSVDDIEVGLPSSAREAMPREKVPKRRSITFTTFQRKQGPPEP